MKITLTGSLGHIGKPLTEELVQQGHAVTVISSTPERKEAIEALGATAAIGTVEDVDFLTHAFSGADAVYTMLPLEEDNDQNLHDLRGKVRTIVNNYVQAITQSKVKHAVHLSSIGAHMDNGNGLIQFHHIAEKILNDLPSEISITFMRPTGFYYNLYTFIPMIKQQGVIAANCGGKDTALLVSPADIAVAVAEELNITNSGRKVRYVASDELTFNETAKILGEAISKPDLKWEIVSDEQMLNGLIATGMNPEIAGAYVEMHAGSNLRKLSEDYYRNRPALGKVKLADFAKEFARVFHNK